MKLSIKELFWPHGLILMPALALFLTLLPFKLHYNEVYQRQTAALGNPQFVQAMTSAGYRTEIGEWSWSPIYATCVRMNDKGPLPCDAVPTWQDLEIRLKTS